MTGSEYEPGLLLQSARELTGAGLAVYLLPPNSKAARKGSHGKNDATHDLRALEAQIHDHPDANIGVRPAASGHVVMDFDFRNGGDRVLGHLVAKRPRAYDTVSVRKETGPHVYFSAPTVPVSTRLHLPPKCGLDILGAGSFAKDVGIVAPHSRVRDHDGDRFYEWAEGRGISEHLMLPFPVEVLDDLQEYFAQPEGKRREVEGEVEVEAGRAEPGSGKDYSPLCEYDKDPRFARAVCGLLGVPFRPEKAFRSPLREDKRPSASIHLAPDGYYRFHDFTTAPDQYYSLAQVYGAWVTGRPYPLPRLSRVEFAVWQTRLLLELGWVEAPVPVSLEPLPLLPPLNAYGAWKNAREVWEGVRLLLQARSVEYGSVVETPLTWRFLTTWCGLSEADVKLGLGWLREQGYIVSVREVPSRYGPMRLWLPRNYATATATPTATQATQPTPDGAPEATHA